MIISCYLCSVNKIIIHLQNLDIMAKKFFSIEVRSEATGEIADIITSNQLKDVETFEEIQDYVIKLANEKKCRGSISNEYGSRVLDYNYSPSCENNICFCWSSEELLNDFIAAHPERPKPKTILEQYHELKALHPDALLLFRCGDFYETYEQDAVESARILGITLTYRNTKDHKWHDTKDAMAGFPHHALDTYLPKLIRAGRRVAICDPLEDPKKTKKLAKRCITELVAPAVVNQ